MNRTRTTFAPTATRSELRADRGQLPWPPLALALVCAAAYCVFLLWPYYASDLDQLPRSEWPHPGNEPGVQGLLFSIGFPFAALVAPLLTIAAVVWAGTWMVLEWEHLYSRGRALLITAIVLAVVLFAFRVSPFANGVITWWLG